MRIPRRDRIASGLVAVAAFVYILWASGAALPGMDSVRVTGLVVLGLGFIASASAVVPGFDRLIHGSKLYMATTSLIGLVALAAGVIMLVDANEAALGLVMGAMLVLWLIATIRHIAITEATPTPSRAGVAGSLTGAGDSEKRLQLAGKETS